MDIEKIDFEKLIPALEKIDDMKDIACSDGNWNHNSYMHGMANDIIFVVSMLKGEDPKYLEKPNEYLCNKN